MEKCKNCNSEFEGNYCNNCGQKAFVASDKYIKNILREIFYFFTNFDNGFLHTIFTIIVKPGQLTIDYCAGKQKTFFKPISLYFLLVVIYLLFPLFSGLNQDLKYYKGNFLFGSIIENQITKKLENQNLTFEELSAQFKPKSEVTSKAALFLFILMSVVFIRILFFRNKRFLYDNLILSAEINIFYLLVLFILLPIVILLISSVFGMDESFIYDELIAFMFIFLFGIYCTVLFKRIFCQKWWLSSIKGITFSLLHALFFITIYRFIVFILTFLQL
ncbi:MAG: DUF3667 domain-containing protein [Saprospiraceae bacterium]|nr:DUF3667 domain-containing protein [Saprospiraceae bacterium]